MPIHGRVGTYTKYGCRCDDCYKAIAEYTRKRYEDGRKILEAAKDKPCTDCGNKFPPECMDFDHMPGADKLTDVGQLTLNPKRMLAEIAKCELVCANCHRIRTRKRKPAGNTRKQFQEI